MADHDPSTDPAAENAEVLDPEQDTIGIETADIQHRLWIKTLVPLLQSRSHDCDPSDRLEKSLVRMFAAAAERVARICRGDMVS